MKKKGSKGKTPPPQNVDGSYHEQLEREAAFLKAWLSKYGWPVGEERPHYENNVIPFAKKTK
jgi:hypothetical protein